MPIIETTTEPQPSGGEVVTAHPQGIEQERKKEQEMKFAIHSLTVIALVVLFNGASVWGAAPKPLSISELASKPDTHIGKVVVVGRVAAVTPGKGFTLIDSTNCATCTTECLTDKNTKKIPFLWVGTAPVVKNVVLVQGTLSRTANGFIFTADNVTKQ